MRRSSRSPAPGPRPLFHAAAALLTTLAACESPTEARPRALLTDGTSFRLDLFPLHQGGRGYSATIPYTFENRIGSTILLSNCLGSFHLDLEMEKAGEWFRFWSGGTCLVDSPPIVIEPGEVLRDTVRAMFPRWFRPPTDPSTPYRLVLTDRMVSLGDTIPLAERVSNSFTLVLPR